GALSTKLGRVVAPADIVRVRLLDNDVASPGALRLSARSGRKFPSRLFCQELAVLLDAGIPLLEALNTLREKEDSAQVAQVLAAVEQSLSHGLTLSQAMRAHPSAFSPLLVASIEAGQRTGQTSQALRQHAV